MLVFLLRNRLLVQLHSYFYLLQPPSNYEKRQETAMIKNGHENNAEGEQQQKQVETVDDGAIAIDNGDQEPKQLLSARVSNLSLLANPTPLV
jgi:hypothetical protein